MSLNISTAIKIELCILVFGVAIVGISYILANTFFPDPRTNAPSIDAINLFVTAILGSAVTMVAMVEMRDKD